MLQGCTSLSLPASTEGSLSDSGISDSGSEQESERERRLSALRRLARQLESLLSPNSQAYLDMNRVCTTLLYFLQYEERCLYKVHSKYLFRKLGSLKSIINHDNNINSYIKAIHFWKACYFIKNNSYYTG